MPKREVRRVTAWGFIKGIFKIIGVGISILTFLLFAFFFMSIISAFIGPELLLETGNVAVIPITGVISTTGETGFRESGTTSEKIVEFIKDADENSNVNAILLEINSPGGAPVATDEIAQAVKNANKTTVAVIRETGASGAFWVATAADYVFANRMSVTGSIGVKSSYLEFAGLLRDYNVTYRRLVAGAYKDTGSPFREMSPAEQALFQRILDKLQGEFIHAVAENRRLTEDYVRQLATGFVYLGSEAKELGLVDELGNKEAALKWIEKRLNITAKPVEYKEPKGLLAALSEFSTENFFSLGRGIGDSLVSDGSPSFS